MSDLIVHIANCTVCGSEVSDYPDGSWQRDTIQLNLDGIDVTLRQNTNLIKEYTNPTGRFVPATSLFFQNVTEQNQARFLDMSDRVCEMLSFATGSRVVRYGFSINGSLSRESVFGTVEGQRPPFDPIEVSGIKLFIEQCFAKFCQIRDVRQLVVVFDYIYHSNKKGVALELKLATLFILLENIKYSFAKEQNYTIKGDYFYKNGSRLNFQTLLEETFDAVGMTSGFGPIITMRNAIVHTGLSSASASNMQCMHNDIQNIVREYILRLLCYKGSYKAYAPWEQQVIA